MNVNYDQLLFYNKDLMDIKGAKILSIPPIFKCSYWRQNSEFEYKNSTNRCAMAERFIHRGLNSQLSHWHPLTTLAPSVCQDKPRSVLLSTPLGNDQKPLAVQHPMRNQPSSLSILLEVLPPKHNLAHICGSTR
ncbi:hypothetical protein G6F57_021634 [Rhizopus arrhizus]|nr:hypothetical protein G6F29_014210 [Rhizopus arrhizus]KAG1079865.1 hypothetical protein G6F39_014212 [Rhizopus arrhizus]KAG1245344.1 hypothetical protein G6F65_021281 [Rhizopus arrhizus]KAG1361613.1 hypothetical protein G6F61_014264 [Rhizopus arrhizus]KAG1386510.1 hypothetical protein G6F59_016824 [Rhizopus arrhizus]